MLLLISLFSVICTWIAYLFVQPKRDGDAEACETGDWHDSLKEKYVLEEISNSIYFGLDTGFDLSEVRWTTGIPRNPRSWTRVELEDWKERVRGNLGTIVDNVLCYEFARFYADVYSNPPDLMLLRSLPILFQLHLEKLFKYGMESYPIGATRQMVTTRPVDRLALKLALELIPDTREYAVEWTETNTLVKKEELSTWDSVDFGQWSAGLGERYGFPVNFTSYSDLGRFVANSMPLLMPINLWIHVNLAFHEGRDFSHGRRIGKELYIYRKPRTFEQHLALLVRNGHPAVTVGCKSDIPYFKILDFEHIAQYLGRVLGIRLSPVNVRNVMDKMADLGRLREC